MYRTEMFTLITGPDAAKNSYARDSPSRGPEIAEHLGPLGVGLLREIVPGISMVHDPEPAHAMERTTGIWFEHPALQESVQDLF
jgi:hypothetical protein